MAIEKLVPRNECLFHFPPLPWSFGVGTVWACDTCGARYELTRDGWKRIQGVRQ